MTRGGAIQKIVLLTTNNDVHAPVILVLSEPAVRAVTFGPRVRTKNGADDFDGFISDGLSS